MDLDVFDRNCVKMQGFLEGTGMRLRPHYKSTKCTAIAHMQMEKGAKGTALGRNGEPVCEAEVLEVKTAKAFDQTRLLTMRIPKEYAMKARFFRAAESGVGA